MSLSGKKKSIVTQLKKEIKSFQSTTKASLRKMDAAIRKSVDKNLVKVYTQEKKQHLSHLERLLKKTDTLKIELEEAIKKETITLRKKVKKLEDLQTTTEANNYLLEYKRKDLLQQSEELNSANENIRKQNEELLAQKEQIALEVDRLKKIQEEILEKKNELEEKTDALLDQTDYLHEANQVITQMHQELAKQKDEIVSKNEELLHLNQEKNNLIGIVAHDLKSPLNQIKGLVTVVKMTAKNMDREATSCLGLIENSANRMTDMISKILDIEAIESQQLNLSIERINIADHLKVIADRFKRESERKSIQLHYASLLPIEIEADSGYFNQIVENLLSNAIKFSPSGKDIYLSVADEQGKATIRIQDEGPGMTEEDMKKLFNKYQKLSARPTGNESSTGLGLSIVKKFVEAMQGKIWCESEAGKGATFFVQFNKV